MLSNQPQDNDEIAKRAPLPLNGRAKLGPVLAIFVLALLAAAVFSFSALAAIPECWRQAAEPRLLELDGSSSSGPKQRFLQHNDADSAGQLQLFLPDSSLALATKTVWPLADSSGPAAPFYASPQPLDNNYDGLTEQLISTDFSGRIWLTDVTASGFGATILLANLVHGDWRFISSAGIVDVSLPMSLRPAGLAGRYKLLLLIARNISTGEDALVTFRIPAEGADPSLVRFDNLMDRSVLAEAERDSGISNEQWFSIIDSAGWWVKMAGQLTQPPQVIAGVIYSAVATSDFSAEECASQSAEHSLVAMHLHSAGQVYHQRRFRLTTGQGQLKLQQQADGSAALILHDVDEQHILLTELQKISPSCPDCSELLQLDQFPRWLKLATYRQETGAH